MKKNFNDPIIRKKTYEKLKSILEAATDDIKAKKRNDLYGLDAHQYLINHAWEIMFPLEYSEWPEEFHKVHFTKKISWPSETTSSYIMKVILPPFINSFSLCFGYAILGEELIKTSFFIMADISKYQSITQGMVIDPLARLNEVEPDYYIGCGVEKSIIDDFVFLKKNPLEKFANNETEKRYKRIFHDVNTEEYALQLSLAPHYFPPQLLKFAEGSNLYIPEQL